MDIQFKLFESALGVAEPLYIKEINFDENIGELHICIDFRKGSKFICPFTSLFEAFVLTLAKEMSISAIAKLVNEHDTRIWRIIHFHISKAYARKNMSELSAIGIDETSLRKGHKYILNPTLPNQFGEEPLHLS